jgi:hypothetical protein
LLCLDPNQNITLYNARKYDYTTLQASFEFFDCSDLSEGLSEDCANVRAEIGTKFYVDYYYTYQYY